MRTVHEPRADLPAADLRPARHSAGAATLQDPRADHLPGVRHRRDAGLGREDARPGGDAAVDARHLLAVPVRWARSRPARAAARTVAAADTPGVPDHHADRCRLAGLALPRPRLAGVRAAGAGAAAALDRLTPPHAQAHGPRSQERRVGKA